MPALPFLTTILTGCTGLQPTGRTEEKELKTSQKPETTKESGASEVGFSYDALQQMQKDYYILGVTEDETRYESLKQFETEVFQKRKIAGALTILECIENNVYITIRHHGENAIISGKTVSKCRVVKVGETFNNCSLENDTVLDLTQHYYPYQISEQDEADMFESFGATIEKDAGGAGIGMEIEDGDYLLGMKEGIDYKLVISMGELPMRPGGKYTCALADTLQYPEFLESLNDHTEHYAFKRSASAALIAGELRLCVASVEPDIKTVTLPSGKEVVLSESERSTVMEMLSNDKSWYPDIRCCAPTCQFLGSTGWGLAEYCDSCGGLNDYTNFRSRTLTAEERAFIEDLISRYDPQYGK